MKKQYPVRSQRRLIRTLRDERVTIGSKELERLLEKPREQLSVAERRKLLSVYDPFKNRKDRALLHNREELARLLAKPSAELTNSDRALLEALYGALNVAACISNKPAEKHS